MFIFFAILILGGFLGYIFQRRLSLKILSKCVTCFIYLMLLALGMAVGANDRIIDNLSTIGLKGFCISVSAIIGSLIAAKLLFVLLNKKRADER